MTEINRREGIDDLGGPRIMRQHKQKLVWTTLGLILFCCSYGLTSTSLMIGHFSSLDPATEISAPWEKLSFPSIERQTEYSTIQLDGRTVIRARSKAAASGMVRDLDIDPTRYPWLSWQWRIENTLNKGDVTTKQGDDCAARIYVAFEFVEEGKTFWDRFRHKAACIAAGKKLPGTALTYIWGNKAIPGTIIDSPYTPQSKMVIVESGNGLKGKWVLEKRNIMKDYQTAFGHAPPKIMGIAIMTDTDNTGASTTAYYGDIHLECDS